MIKKKIAALWVVMEISVISSIAVLLTTGNVMAGDPVAGQEKAATCAACHGDDGLTANFPAYPILAGQYPSYLEHALKSYRDGSRQNAIMAGFASALSDEDIADLAAWFASLDGPLQTATPD